MTATDNATTENSEPISATSYELCLQSAALDLLNDDNLLHICEKYAQEEEARKQESLGFNVFRIVSETYYHENFHSDVLAAFLDMKGAHGGETRYLHQFIRLLKNHSPSITQDLHAQEFTDYTTAREKGRIDIRILDDTNRKAIIIENKIYNAVDQECQLPRYVDDVTESGYKVVAVVYLSLNGHKWPNRSDWKHPDDDAKIDPLLICMSAYGLVSDWIQPCTSDDFGASCDAKAILKQYGRLLRYLGAKAMNDPRLTEFYRQVVTQGNYDKVRTLVDMFDKLRPVFMQKVVDKYSGRCAPFSRVRIDTNCGCIFFEDICYDGKTHTGVSLVDSFPEGDYLLSFVGENGQGNTADKVRTILEVSGLLTEKAFSLWDNPWFHMDRYCSRVFKWPAEEQIIFDFLDNVLKKLNLVREGDLPQSTG